MGIVVYVWLEKMEKDVGTAIRKSIVVSFLPCWLLFGDSIPTWSLIFLNVFFVTCFCRFLVGGETFHAEM